MDDKSWSDIANKINVEYKRYTVFLGRFSQETKEVVNKLLCTIEHLPLSAKKEVENLILITSLHNQSLSLKNILNSIAETDNEARKVQIKEAENHCRMGLVKVYLTAINILISAHEYYRERYGGSIAELSAKTEKMEQARFFHRDMSQSIATRTTISNTEFIELRNRFRECLDVIRCHCIRKNSYKSKMKRTFSFAIYALGTLLTILGATYASMPDARKDEIITIVCSSIGINCDLPINPSMDR